MVEEDVCLACGDKGLLHALIYCEGCDSCSVHRYCLPVLPETFDEYVYWYCEDCDTQSQKVSSAVNIPIFVEGGENNFSKSDSIEHHVPKSAPSADNHSSLEIVVSEHDKWKDSESDAKKQTSSVEIPTSVDASELNLEVYDSIVTKTSKFVDSGCSSPHNENVSSTQEMGEELNPALTFSRKKRKDNDNSFLFAKPMDQELQSVPSVELPKVESLAMKERSLVVYKPPLNRVECKVAKTSQSGGVISSSPHNENVSSTQEMGGEQKPAFTFSGKKRKENDNSVHDAESLYMKERSLVVYKPPLNGVECKVAKMSQSGGAISSSPHNENVSSTQEMGGELKPDFTFSGKKRKENDNSVHDAESLFMKEWSLVVYKPPSNKVECTTLINSSSSFQDNNGGSEVTSWSLSLNKRAKRRNKQREKRRSCFTDIPGQDYHIKEDKNVGSSKDNEDGSNKLQMHKTKSQRRRMLRKKRMSSLTNTSVEEPDELNLSSSSKDNKGGSDKLPAVEVASQSSSFNNKKKKHKKQGSTDILRNSHIEAERVTGSLIDLASRQQEYYITAQPIIQPIWRGSFCLNYHRDTIEGLAAHVSNLACRKVYDAAKFMPARLNTELRPMQSFWPKSFTQWGPSDKHIGLYFFATNPRDETVLNGLLDEMIRNDLVMRAVLQNAELLLFTSFILPRQFHKFHGRYYLWGTFKQKTALCVPPLSSITPLQMRETPVPTYSSSSNRTYRYGSYVPPIPSAAFQHPLNNIAPVQMTEARRVRPLNSISPVQMTETRPVRPLNNISPVQRTETPARIYSFSGNCNNGPYVSSTPVARIPPLTNIGTVQRTQTPVRTYSLSGNYGNRGTCIL